MSEHASFALALESTQGVGRVTAGKLLRKFPTYERILATPREQVLVHLKGIPGAGGILERIFDEARMRGSIEQAGKEVAEFQSKRIEVLTNTSDDWPPGLVDLPDAHRPNTLFAYGSSALLRTGAVALLARPPISSESFETAQDLVRGLLDQNITIVGGDSHGFDVVIHKLCTSASLPRPSIMVASAGIARIPAHIRPIAGLNVRQGGLLVSPFPPAHGPFDHDAADRSFIQCAIARAAVFIEPVPGTYEWKVMEWMLRSGRSVFGTRAADTELPARVHRLTEAVDLDWVMAAVRSV